MNSIEKRDRSFRGLSPLILIAALALTGCGDKPPAPAAAAAPPVTVAQPVKRTVTDWDEFTGRFEAVEEVQVRARVGGFHNQRVDGVEQVADFIERTFGGRERAVKLGIKP